MMNTKLVLIMLLLSSAAFADMACMNNATDVILGPNYGVQDLILVVIGFTIIIIALAYTIGTSTNNPSFTIFAKDELYHLGFSILMLLAMSGIVLSSCFVVDFFSASVFQNAGITSTACYNPASTMQDVASCYAKSALDDATTMSTSYIQAYLDNLMYSTMSWSLQWPLLNSYTSSAASYKRIVSNQYDMILNSFLIPAMMSISMQKLALQFINENVVEWLLPIAFLLRVFIPTRQMGNMLIALSLALYVIVPFLYVLNFAMYNTLMSKSDCSEFSGAVCDYIADGGNCTPNSVCTNPDGFWMVARLIPQAFFLPNLTIAIVITFLTAMNKAMKVLG